MDEKIRRRIQLNCLYDMFLDRVEENVVYIVYTENEGKIDTTIDQLMSIASCSFTGHHFDPQPSRLKQSNKKDSCLKPCNVEQEKGNRKQDKNDLKPTQENNDGGKDEDEDANEDLSAKIERFQKSIEDLLEEKRITHDKASQYLSKKMYPVTSYYSDVGSQIRKMIEEKTNKLVDLLLQKSENSDCIDLHGLNPIQARLVVDELLKIRQNKLLIDKQGEASIDIITGWGKHTPMSRVTQRVRPTIITFLRENGFEFQYLNKGALRVTIRR